MEKKWNLQDIKPAAGKRGSRAAEHRAAEPREEFRKTPPQTEQQRSARSVGGIKRKKTVATVGLTVVLLVAGVLGATLLLGGTEITVYPRHREPNINATFTAYKTPQVGELSYELMILEADGERQVSATGQEEVTEQAAGEIEIFNRTANTERLIKNTRFESPDGLIFHITESAVVPAAKKAESGELVPGSVIAKVFAEKAGEEYNLAPARFTVPGYRENGFTDLYENIYAESRESFRGGFDGTKFIIAEDELNAAKETLHAELKEALLSRVDEERPAGFVVFDNATTFTFESQPSVESGENLATIKEKAVLRIPIFAEDEFASYLAAATIPGYEQEPVRIDDQNSLTFSYASTSTPDSNLGSLDSFDFKLTGKPLIVWSYDALKLRSDLAGSPKTALPNILGAYPAIEKAEAVVRPFWKRSFTDDVEDIKITESIQG